MSSDASAFQSILTRAIFDQIAASPSCSIAERVRIVEDVIIQLEHDYPVWSAVHFNQPDRVVSCNSVKCKGDITTIYLLLNVFASLPILFLI